MVELWMVVLTGLVGLRLSVIDLAEHRLPNRLTLPLFVSLVVVSGVGGDSVSLYGALVGSVVSGVVFLGLATMPGKPLGMGDVKFQFSLGWMLGYLDPALAVMGASGSFVVGGLSVIPRLIWNGGKASDPVPLGPWMMVATCCVVVGAESLKII
ncbi:prepilin peptidase [Pontimonas sp.]|jgi:leader peptidase (prepilin peptidase)/N-methyltransferase|nr:prepilin peptidase [Pontimonas sp.]MDA8887167.1 prepilin peptidase [Pontimonas sp.]